ncbi:MAG TPA: hypothetical protein VFE84_09645 [Patescibacteria group bacterium]|jgi:hypothetical protein|nr:hypothetical protein [Patescibacteria group bacterium]
MPEDGSVRDRLQNTLLRVGRGARPKPARRSSTRWDRIAPGEGAVQAGPAVPSAAPANSAAPAAAAATMPASMPSAPDDEPEDAGLAAELLDRLDRIEQRLGDLQRPVRPIPPSRELFAEWVRLRQWEEMPFGDFLKLRRAGRV